MYTVKNKINNNSLTIEYVNVIISILQWPSLALALTSNLYIYDNLQRRNLVILINFAENLYLSNVIKHIPYNLLERVYINIEPNYVFILCQW